MILEKFLRNSSKKVITVGESGDIPHFCYLGHVGSMQISSILTSLELWENVGLNMLTAFPARLDICGFLKELGCSSKPEMFTFRLIYSNWLLDPKSRRRGGGEEKRLFHIDKPDKDFCFENVTRSTVAHKLHWGSSL